MDGVLLNQELVFRVIDLTGVVGAGCLGGTVARRHKFDLVGFLILGISTALGGGILRDLMLNLTPIALTDNAYLVAAVCGVFISMVLRIDGRKFWVNLFSLVDAMTIGSWAATGASKTLAAGLGVGPALVLGVITAVGGGVTRDILVGRTPEVFGGNTLYATPALAGAAVVTMVHGIGYPGVGMIAGTITGIALCLPAQLFGWSLPVIPDWSLDSAAAEMLRKVKGDKSRRAKSHLKGLQMMEEQVHQAQMQAAEDAATSEPGDGFPADTEPPGESPAEGTPPPPIFDKTM